MTSFQQYMTDAMTEAGLTDEQVTSAMSKLYAHEKLSPKLNALVKTATEDYNAQVGRVTALTNAQTAREKEITEWHGRVNAQYKQALDELETFKRGGAPVDFDATKYVSKEDLKNTVTEIGNRWAGVLKDATSITAAHVSRFHEPPDLEAIEKIAAEQNLPIRAAYEKYIEPRVKDEDAKSRVQWEKDKTAEIERDVRSRFKLPVDPKPAETAPMYNRADKKDIPADFDQELMEAWHGAGTAAK